MSAKEDILQPDFSHLSRLTTTIGLVQHAQKNQPDFRYGYSIDDNARALIVCYRQMELFGIDKNMLLLSKIYLQFIERAQNPDGSFHNFTNDAGDFLDDRGSEDSFARTYWALNYIAARGEIDQENSILARNVLDKILSPEKIAKNYSRTLAFLICGYAEAGDSTNASRLADLLVARYLTNRRPSWRWFEHGLTYSNAILPYSLFLAYKLVGKETYLKVAAESFDFLNRVCRLGKTPMVIGQNGWFSLGLKKHHYDQQAIDACDMVLAACEAYKALGDEKHLLVAYEWFEWFWGNNICGKIMIDPKSSGCYDGIMPKDINRNQGAESIIAYLLAYLALAAL